MNGNKMDLKSLIRTVPNYPKPGILFRDISTLLYNGNALKYITEIYYNRYKDIDLNGIAAIEARGFIFGAILAEKLGIAFIPIRKKGKLPCKVFSKLLLSNKGAISSSGSFLTFTPDAILIVHCFPISAPNNWGNTPIPTVLLLIIFFLIFN